MQQKPTIRMLAVFVCLAAGCIGSKRSKAAQEQQLKAYILDAVPADIPHKLDINYDDKIHLVGYNVDPATTAAPESEVKLTMYWRVDEKLDDGWSLFTHITDAGGERILNIDNVGPLREVKDTHQVLWPSAWEKGKVYVDEQSFAVPADVKSPEIAIMTGIWKGDNRLKIKAGPGDSQERGLVVRLQTGLGGSTPVHVPIPTLNVAKLGKGQKVVIDGKLDDEVWKTAATTGPFIDVGTGKVNPTFPIGGSARVAFDDANLYIAFQVTDPDVVGGVAKDDKKARPWTRDAVEVVIDPDGDGDNQDYYEIQINPQNLVFDSQYDSYNSPKTEPNGPFGHEEWSAKLKSAVVVDGTLDHPGDEDKGYAVEMAIPWSSFGKAKTKPPAAGDTWRMNFYAVQNNSGVGWSALLGQGNFHKASRFGRVVWGSASAATVASAAPPASAAPAVGTARTMIPKPAASHHP